MYCQEVSFIVRRQQTKGVGKRDGERRKWHEQQGKTLVFGLSLEGEAAAPPPGTMHEV